MCCGEVVIAEDLQTFQAAIKWFSKHLQVQLLQCLTNCRSLCILGYSRPQEVLVIVSSICASRILAQIFNKSLFNGRK